MVSFCLYLNKISILFFFSFSSCNSMPSSSLFKVFCFFLFRYQRTKNTIAATKTTMKMTPTAIEPETEGLLPVISVEDCVGSNMAIFKGSNLTMCEKVEGGVVASQGWKVCKVVEGA